MSSEQRAASGEQRASNDAGSPAALELQGALVALAEAIRRVTVQVRAGRRGGASGVIWTADGLVVTAAHVVRGAGHAEVELADGRVLKARVNAQDPERDLATLSLDATELPAAELGDSAALRVGALVFAVGHPNGVRGAVTAGVVHGFGGSGDDSELLLADLRLAPGNSGGPLVDALGRVVGVNTMIANGLAIAIPSSVVKRFVAHPQATPVLGVSVQPVGWLEQGRRRLGLLVLEVATGSGAERAGVLIGDVLLGAGGRSFGAVGDLRRAIRGIAASGAIDLELVRAGKPVQLRAAVAHHPPQAEAA